MSDPRAALLAALSALEQQRAVLGDAATEAALGALRAQLATLPPAPTDAPAASAGPAAPGVPGGDLPSPPPPPAPPPRREQQLRQVSVLFLDMVGSTRLVGKLDPEQVQDVLDGALAALTDIVRAHEGEVLQYAGDNLLAAFGASGARDDDAERAVACGLALLAEGRARGEQVQQRFGHEGFGVRVGIHTGSVLRGGGVDGDNTLRGQAVHVAARVEQAAPPFSLLISHETYGLVRGLFDMRPREPVAAKGVERPLRVWLVDAHKPRRLRLQPRGIEGLETPLIGREAELGRLFAAFDAVCDESVVRTIRGDVRGDVKGRPDRRASERTRPAGRRRALPAPPEPSVRTFTLLADPGLGKSRLMQELLHGLAARGWEPRLLRARMQPAHRLRPYALMHELLAWQFDIADSDSAAAARDKLVAGLGPWLGQPGDPPVAALGQLIGMDFTAELDARHLGLARDARLLRDRALAVFGTWLARVCASDGAPLVLLLDDLQWADDASLDVLPALIAQAGAAGVAGAAATQAAARSNPSSQSPAAASGHGPAPATVLAVLGARPSLLERRPKWGEQSPQLPSHKRIVLAPLDEAARRRLTAALLTRLPDAPEELLALLEQRTEGNPFYAEEILRMLLDDGVIVVADDGTWRVEPERLAAARLPATLTGVLQARIDALAAEERHSLQAASIVGPVFWDEALSELRRGGEAYLPALERRGMVLRHATSAIAGSAERHFHHHLLHQVSYDTVLPSVRREGHARAAAWLAARVGERAQEHLAVTAEHYERAGDRRRAFEWFMRAAREASLRYAARTALAHSDHALALLAEAEAAPGGEKFEPGTAELFELHKMRMGAADILSQRDVHAASLDAIERLATAAGDEPLRSFVLVNRALLADRLGEPVQARRLAEEAVTASEGCDDAPRALLAHGELAWLDISQHHFDAARVHIERALHWARLTAERDGTPEARGYEAQVLLVASRLYQETRDRTALRAAQERALAIATREGLKRIEVSCAQSLASAALQEADLEAAQRLAEQSLALSEAMALVMHGVGARLVLARVAMNAGQADEALAWLEEAREAARRGNVREDGAHASGLIAELLRQRGQFEAAARLFGETAADYQSRGDGVNACAARLQRAGAAWQAWQAGDRAGRAAVTEPLAAVLAEWPTIEREGALDAAEQGRQARLAAWRVLRAAGDARAAVQLELAWRETMADADAAGEPAVRNREVLAAQAEMGGR